MLRFRVPELFLGCFLTVAVFAAGMLFANGPNASYTAQSERTEKPNEPTNSKSSPKSFWEPLSTDPVAAFTMGLVLVGMVQAGLFYVQLKLIGETLRPAKAAAEAAVDAARIARNAQRPYFSPFSPELRYWREAIIDSNPYQNLEIHLDITNIGSGTGFVHFYAIAHEICARDAPGNVPVAIRDYLGRIPLRPDARWEVGAPFDNLQIGDDDRQALITFRKTLYCYGYVRYLDMFGIFRKTGFLFEFIPSDDFSKGSFAMSPSPVWWYDEEEPKTS